MQGDCGEKKRDAKTQGVGQKQGNSLVDCLLGGSHHEDGGQYGADAGGPSGGEDESHEKTSQKPGRFVPQIDPLLSQKHVDVEDSCNMHPEEENEDASSLPDEPHLLLEKGPDGCGRGPQQDEDGSEPGDESQGVEHRLTPYLPGGLLRLKVGKGEPGDIGDAGMIGYGMESESDEDVKPMKIKKPRMSKKSKMEDKEDREEMHKIAEQGKKHMKRAEIVRKVMKEQNLSMINASKYVKQNNLYKP